MIRILSWPAMALLLAATAAGPGAARAEEHGSPAEAKAMLDKAAAHYQAVGRDAALADFTDDRAAYVDRDLYVFCLNGADGIWTAHGANRSLLGRDATKVRDLDGNSIGGAVLAAVQDQPEGFVEYRWPNPVTRKIEQKSAFVRRVGDQVCAVGTYR